MPFLFLISRILIWPPTIVFFVCYSAQKRGRYMTQNFCNFCHVAFKSLKTILHYWIYEKVHNSSKRQIWLLNILNREFENKEERRENWANIPNLIEYEAFLKKLWEKLALKKGVIDLCPTNSKEYWWVLNLVLATRHFKNSSIITTHCYKISLIVSKSKYRITLPPLHFLF